MPKSLAHAEVELCNASQKALIEKIPSKAVAIGEN